MSIQESHGATLQESNPFQDLVSLIRRPGSFFAELSSPYQVTAWVAFKALFLMFLMATLVLLAKLPLELRDTHVGVTTLSDALAGAALGGNPWMRGLNLESLLPSLHRSEWGLAFVLVLIKTFWAPFAWMLGLLVTSAGACLLLPLFGVQPSRVSFPQVFIVGAYARSLGGLEMLPGFSSLIVALIVFGVHAWAISKVFGLRWSQGAVCLSALPLLYLCGGLFFLGITGFAAIFAS